MMLRNRKIRLGLSVLTALSLIIIAIAHVFQPAIPSATRWVLAWAGLESLVVFGALCWALSRSNLAFLSVYFGGTLIRLLSLGVIALLLVSLDIPPTIPLLALASAYFLFSIVQLPFINHELR